MVTKNMLFLIFFVYSVGFTIGRDSDLCQNGPPNSCGFKKIMFARMLDNEIFPTAKFLSDYCTDLVDGVQCLDKFNKTCPLPSDSMRSPDVVIRQFKDMAMFIEELCDECSTLRENYEKNIDCVNEHASSIFDKDLHRILKAFQELMYSLRYPEEEYEPIIVHESEEEHEALLEMLEQNADCIMTEILFMGLGESFSKYCGEDAEDISTKILGKLILTPEEACSGADESRQSFHDMFQEYLGSIDKR